MARRLLGLPRELDLRAVVAYRCAGGRSTPYVRREQVTLIDSAPV